MAMNSLGLGLTVTYKDLASQGIGKTGKSLNRLGSSANRMGSSSSEAFGKFQAGVAKLAVATVAIKGVVSALRGATKAASDFGKAIGEVSTLTSEAEIPTSKLRDISLKMSDEFGGAPVDQAKALYQAISAGAGDAASAQDVLAASNKLAIGGVTDVGTALDGLTSTLNAYGMEFSQANEVSDAFFIAVKKGKTTVGELSAVVGRLAPTANAVGISMDEMLASIAAVTTQGLKTSEATTGLKAALANIIKPSKDAQKAAKALGVDFSTAALRSKGLNQFLKDITGSAKFNKDSLGELFTSVEGLNAITALTANQGVKFQDTLDAMANKAGATETAFDKMANTLAFQEDKFAALVDVAKVMIGEALVPLARKVIEFGATVVKWFNKLPAPVRDMIVKGVALLGVIVALAAAAAAVGSAIGLIAPALAALAPVLGVVAAVAGPVVATFLALKQHFEANKEGAEKFGGAMSSIWNTIKNAVSIAGQVLESFFGGMKAGFQSFITEAKPTIDAFVDALDELAKAFALEDGEAGVDTINKAAGAGAVAGRIFGKLAEMIIRSVTMLINIGVGMAKAWKAAGDVMDPLFSAISDVGGDLRTILSDVGALNSSVGEGASLWQALGGAITASIGQGAAILGTVVRSIGSLIGSIISVVGGMVNIIGGIMSGDWGRVWQGAQQVVFGIVSAIINLMVTMVSAVTQALDAVGKAVGKDLGLTKGVQDLQRNLETSLKRRLEIVAKAEVAPAAAAAEVTGAPAFQAVPAGSFGEPFTPPALLPPIPGPAAATPAGLDPASIKSAAVAAASAAGKASPPQIVKATMTVDGEVLGEIAARFDKDGSPTAPVEIL